MADEVKPCSGSLLLSIHRRSRVSVGLKARRILARRGRSLFSAVKALHSSVESVFSVGARILSGTFRWNDNILFSRGPFSALSFAANFIEPLPLPEPMRVISSASLGSFETNFQRVLESLQSRFSSPQCSTKRQSSRRNTLTDP